MVTTMSPCASAKPACSALALPKLRRSRTTRTLSCAACSRVSAENVPSVEPSSTKTTSHARRAARAPSRARRRGARRCAPRRVPGRSPRSRPLAYVPDAPVAVDRRSPRARARAGPAARVGARFGRRSRGPCARGGRRGADRPAAVPELGDGRLRDQGGGSSRESCRSSSGSPPGYPPSGRWRPERRCRSRRAARCPPEQTPSCRSRMLSNMTTACKSPDPVDAGAHIRPTGGDVRAGEALLAAGTVLGAAQIGALAAAGVAEVSCAAGRGSSCSVLGPSCGRPARRLVRGRSTSRTARCWRPRSRPPARWSTGSDPSPTTKRSIGARSSGGSRPTFS